jgi:hypothetical protein
MLPAIAVARMEGRTAPAAAFLSPVARDYPSRALEGFFSSFNRFGRVRELTRLSLRSAASLAIFRYAPQEPVPGQPQVPALRGLTVPRNRYCHDVDTPARAAGYSSATERVAFPALEAHLTGHSLGEINLDEGEGFLRLSLTSPPAQHLALSDRPRIAIG